MPAANEHYHRIETADMKQDVDYYLARLEGQLARIEFLTEPSQSPFAIYDELRSTLTSAKNFLASLRLALDTRRIDVA